KHAFSFTKLIFLIYELKFVLTKMFFDICTNLMCMDKATESESRYSDLDQMSVCELLNNINQEDNSVPLAVNKAIKDIEKLVLSIIPRMEKGGRLFYIGAGTSGRLGVVDASECPPTFGVGFD